MTPCFRVDVAVKQIVNLVNICGGIVIEVHRSCRGRYSGLFCALDVEFDVVFMAVEPLAEAEHCEVLIVEFGNVYRILIVGGGLQGVEINTADFHHAVSLFSGHIVHPHITAAIGNLGIETVGKNYLVVADCGNHRVSAELGVIACFGEVIDGDGLTGIVFTYHLVVGNGDAACRGIIFALEVVSHGDAFSAERCRPLPEP